MNSNRNITRRALFALSASAVFAGLTSHIAYADPQSELEAASAKLDSLGTKLTQAEDDLNEKTYALDATNNKIGDVQAEISETEKKLEVQRGILEPHLADYLRRYPQVALEVVVENRHISLIQDGIDVALRVGAPAQEDVVARQLASFAFGLYASADYLAAHAPLETPENLAQHALLHKFDGSDWLLRRGIERYHLRAKKRVSANDAFLLARLAAAGEGIALLPQLPALTNGLQRVLPEWATESLPLYALYYKNHGFAPTVRSFIDWLAAVLAA